MENNKEGSNKRFVGIIVAVVVLVLIYFLFYSGDKTSGEETQQMEATQQSTKVKLPNVEDATPNIEVAKPLKNEPNQAEPK